MEIFGEWGKRTFAICPKRLQNIGQVLASDIIQHFVFKQHIAPCKTVLCQCYKTYNTPCQK